MFSTENPALDDHLDQEPNDMDICNVCDGKGGWEEKDKQIECPWCEGEGKIDYSEYGESFKVVIDKADY